MKHKLIILLLLLSSFLFSKEPLIREKFDIINAGLTISDSARIFDKPTFSSGVITVTTF